MTLVSVVIGDVSVKRPVLVITLSSAQPPSAGKGASWVKYLSGVTDAFWVINPLLALNTSLVSYLYMVKNHSQGMTADWKVRGPSEMNRGLKKAHNPHPCS